MKKYLVLALAFAAAIVFSSAVYAEVQNVKVGGDITARYVRDTNLDLNNDMQTQNSSTNDFFMTTTRVYVSADLTDNVQTYIRFLNERDWDAADNISNTDAADSLHVDLSYIKLSEFLYSPLTVTIGRQEILWGSGLVVGDGTPIGTGNINLRNEYFSVRKAFDAVRATLNFDPWTIDTFAARINQDVNNAVNDGQNENLVGANVSYMWSNEILTEGYYVGLFDKDKTIANSSEVDTVGLRAEGPIKALDENLSFELEAAKQWGHYISDNDIDSWAGIAGASYAFKNDYKPIVGLKYDYRSGNDGGKDYAGWNAAYNSYKIGNIIDKVWTHGDYQLAGTDPRGAGGNIHALTASGSIMPVEDIALSLDWIYARADESQLGGCGRTIGNELIGAVTYDYTEDVTFAFTGSLFDPSNAFRSADEERNAYELVGSVMVEF